MIEFGDKQGAPVDAFEGISCSEPDGLSDGILTELATHLSDDGFDREGAILEMRFLADVLVKAAATLEAAPAPAVRQPSAGR